MSRGNFKTAISILRTSKWRSLLTMLGIIIGISSVVTIVSLGEGVKYQIIGQIDKLGSNVLTIRSGNVVGNNSQLNLFGFLSASTLTESDLNTVKKVKSVESVVPFNFVTNTISVNNTDSSNVFVIGTNQYMPDVLSKKVNYGSFFTMASPDQKFAVIGKNVAHTIFNEYNPVGKPITIKGQSFIIRGVLEDTPGGLLSVAQIDFNSSVFIPLDSSRQLSGGTTNILQILVKTAPQADANNVIADINSALRTSHGHNDFSVLKQEQLLGVADDIVGKITAFISGIAAISLLVGGIGIMNIMLVSVSERTREIGVRKAIGANNSQILSQFLTEGLVLSLAGGIIGIITSLAINFGLKIYTDWDPIISWKLLATAVSVSVIVGILFSTAPAFKAARKDPIEALRAS